jgi:F-type H+-transporting ATPase subunit a
VTIYSPFEAAVPAVVQATLLAAGLMILAGVHVRRRLAAAGGGVVPDEGVTLCNILEVLIEALANLARERIGEDWRRYFPIIATMFLFILVSNLMGLIPGVGGATSDVNTTFGWAVIAWLLYTWVGIAKHKGRYLIKYMGPSFGVTKIFGRTLHLRWLAPFMMIIEIPLDLARMGTLALRLLANMFADHVVVAVWVKLVPILVPAIFMGLGLVVAVLQAFVFSLLTMIYVGLALDEPH